MRTAIHNRVVDFHEHKVSRGVEAIFQLDLDPIKIKLMDHKEGEGWTRAQADVVEHWYKRYLILNLKYPDDSIVPNSLIDTFWHYHILDTMKYADDCQNIFGHFLHHFPYFGMRGDEDAKKLKEAFDSTRNLFSCEFGESLDKLHSAFPSDDSQTSAKCDAGNCRSCKGEPYASVSEDRPRFVLGS